MNRSIRKMTQPTCVGALVYGQIVALGERSVAVFTDVLLFRPVRLANLADELRRTAVQF